ASTHHRTAHSALVAHRGDQAARPQSAAIRRGRHAAGAPGSSIGCNDDNRQTGVERTTSESASLVLAPSLTSAQPSWAHHRPQRLPTRQWSGVGTPAWGSAADQLAALGWQLAG